MPIPKQHARRALALSCLALFSASSVQADTFNWIGTSTSNAWSDPNNWLDLTTPAQSPFPYPTGSDTAILDTGGYNYVNFLSPELSLDTLQLPGPYNPGFFGQLPSGSLPYTLSSNNGSGSTILHLNQITAGPVSSFFPRAGGQNILDNTITLQGPDNAPLSISATQSLSIQGNIIAPGGLSFSGGNSPINSGPLELHGASNSFPSLNISGSVIAYGTGSIHNATINIGTTFFPSPTLTLVDDAPVANYDNDINVTGYATLAVRPTTPNDQPFGDPASTTFQLGNVTLNSLPFFGSSLKIDNARSHDLVQFQNLDITGRATLFGASPSYNNPRTVAQFSSLTGHVVVDPPGGPIIIQPIGTGSSSLVINGGEFDFAGVAATPGDITVQSGLLVAQSDGALGAGSIYVNSSGALRFDAPQSTLPNITIDAGGAVGGNLTGASYGQNISLADGAILFPTAGPLPARPSAGPVYWRGIDSLTSTFTVGDDGSSSIYRGAAFGSFTPDGPFTGTINEASPGSGIQILASGYTALGDPVSGAAATFNSTKDVTITLTGPNEFDFFQPLAGTAHVFNLFAPADYATANPGPGTFAFLNSGVIPAGDTVNLKTGQLYITDFGDAVADGAKVNVFAGARLSESGSGALSTGAFEIMPGGVLSLRSADATGGAQFIFDPGSIVELLFGTGNSDWLPSQSDIAIDFVVDRIGAGLQLAPTQRLTSLTGGELSNTPITPRPDAPSDAVFKFTSLAGNTQYGGLTILSPVTFSPGQTLQIGDTVPSLYNGQLPTGSVIFSGNVVNVDKLNVVSGILLLGSFNGAPPQINANTITISHGATLAGAGIINANQLTIAGSLASSYPIAPLQITANTTLLPGSSIELSITSTSPLAAPGVDSSLFLLNGPLAIDPAAPSDPITLTPEFVDIYGNPNPFLDFDPTLPHTFPFLQATSITGFNPLAFSLDLTQLPTLYDGAWSIQQSSPTELDLVYTPAVPEPAALLILSVLFPFSLSRHSRREQG